MAHCIFMRTQDLYQTLMEGHLLWNMVMQVVSPLLFLEAKTMEIVTMPI